MPGHVTLGTAHSAGPPHLILISLFSSLPLSLMSQGLVLSKMPCSSWFSGQPSKTAQAWPLIHLPCWVDGSAWTIHWVFLFPVFPTCSFVLVNQERLRYSPQRRGESSSWMPQQWLGECGVCKSTWLLPTFLFHSATANCISVHGYHIFLCVNTLKKWM